jgi:hypothetical protein
MRKSLAVLAAVGLVATMAVAFAGPAGAKNSPKPSGPKPPPKESKCSSKSTKGIEYAMNGFLTGVGGAGKTAFVQNGSAITTIVDQTFAAATQAGLVKPTQDTVTLALTSQCTGKTTASFKFGLQYKDKTTGTTTGTPLVQQSGTAVIVKGHWLITPVTVCDITNLLGMAIPGATYGNQCYQAAGLPVPTS